MSDYIGGTLHQRRADRKAAGCCPECGLKVLTAHIYCALCRRYWRTKARERVSRQTLHDLCIRCPRPALPDGVMCRVHKLENAAACQRYRDKQKLRLAA